MVDLFHLQPVRGKLVTLSRQSRLTLAECGNLWFPLEDLPLALLDCGNERYSLSSGRSLQCLHLKIFACLLDLHIHVVHALAQSTSELGKDFLLPLVVLGVDLDLHLVIIDGDISELATDIGVVKCSTSLTNLLEKL